MPDSLIVDCSTGQATTQPYSAADTADQQTTAAASQARQQLQANAATIEANIGKHLTQLETWLAANPTGAVLTAAQTATVARMLVGTGRLLLGLVDTIGQAG